MKIQAEQTRTLHALLNNNKMMGQKAALILGFTDGRSESSKDLTYQEAGALINHLKSIDSSHKMRRRIIKMAHEMGWKLKDSSKIDIERVNEWCVKFGYGHKPLNDYSPVELPKLVSQFEFGPYKHYISNL